MFARLRGGGRHAEHDEDPKAGFLGGKAGQLSATQKALTDLGLTDQFVASGASRLMYKQIVALYEQLNSDNSEMVQDLKRITFDEVNAVLQMVGLNPTPDALGTILNDCKLICPISLKNLVRVWSKYLDSCDEELLLWRAFQVFDRDGSGGVTHDEFRETMMELGDKLTDEECSLFVRLIDDNNDGIVQWSEFLSALKTGGTMFDYGEDADGKVAAPPDMGALSINTPPGVQQPQATFEPLTKYSRLETLKSGHVRDEGEGSERAAEPPAASPSPLSPTSLTIED